MTESPTPVESEQSKQRTKLLNAAYGAATKRLRDENLDRFRDLYVEEAKERGIDYVPKPTKEEKAEQALAQLLAENPDLRGRLVDELKAQSE
jgi:hypothetical protein